jgi:hypothetical protein
VSDVAHGPLVLLNTVYILIFTVKREDYMYKFVIGTLHVHRTFSSNFWSDTFIVDLLYFREADSVQKLMQDELGFLESCLKMNPKSYGAWQHRCFIMENMPRPDWERELQLCNTFLQYDERNCEFYGLVNTVMLAYCVLVRSVDWSIQ